MTSTPAPFAGFAPQAIQFLADLAQHNDRAWFQPRKRDYERLLKAPMEALIATLSERLADRGIPLAADPQRSPFRIYRDTRFSRDKSPYKTNLGASFPWVDRVAATGDQAGLPESASSQARGGGGYFSFAPGEMYVGGGMWRPEKPRLDAFRRALLDEPGRVQAALEEPGFLVWFGGAHSDESLKRIPPGFPREHPMADLARWKDVIFGRRLADADVLGPHLPDVLADGFAAAMPVFRFLATLG